MLETLIIPLYGRKLCNVAFPTLYADKSATELGAVLARDERGANVSGLGTLAH